MGKFKTNFIKDFKYYLITAIISLAIGALIFLLYFFLNSRTLYDAINGTTIAFAILLGLGGLAFCGHLGAYDGMQYGFMQLFAGAFAKKANKYNDFPGYVQDKREKRATSPNIAISFIFVSALFGIALIVLEIIYHSN